MIDTGLDNSVRSGYLVTCIQCVCS
jgi:hypothetical protein